MARTVSVCLFVVLSFASESIGRRVHEEQFSEELLLRPLPDRKVLSHFHFESKVPPANVYGRHHRLFPKAIYQLVQRFQVREMELSFTQGRWNYERWGGFDPISSNYAKPPGVELWAVFDVPSHQVDSFWKNLTHALSGLFCASINFLESSATYSAPEWAFRSFSQNLRYGTLPREAVCTENLTPWLKLLPCRDQAGLSALMDRPSIYRGFYHSQQLRLTSGEFDTEAEISGIVLEQTLTIVLQPNALGSDVAFSGGQIKQPSWSITSLFGRKINGKCVVANYSNVYVQLEGTLVSGLNIVSEEDKGSEIESFSWRNSNFELSDPPERVIKEVNSAQKKEPSIVYEYSIEDYNASKPFDLTFRWYVPVAWSCAPSPLQANRFLMGNGNERGSIALSLLSTKWIGSFKSLDHDKDKEKCRLRVEVFQVVPWYVKVYYHTLRLFVDGLSHSLADAVEKMRVSPSEDKVSPGVMEMILRLPCNLKSASLTLEFDKGFLHIDDYPPDANQGFDIPSAVVSFPEFEAFLQFPQGSNLNESGVLSKLQQKSKLVSYTEVLLVPLTTPDFSMPYNVITITCTVFALYFGSLMNALRRRAGEEEKLLKNKDATKKGNLPSLLFKLFAKLRGRPLEEAKSVPSSSSTLISPTFIMKVILVAGIAAWWQYYSG